MRDQDDASVVTFIRRTVQAHIKAIPGIMQPLGVGRVVTARPVWPRKIILYNLLL